MSEKRFHKDMLNIVDVLTNRAYTFEFEEDLDEMLDLLNDLNDGNRQLKQILKDIVEVTDETYSKNRNMFKVTVVFDYRKYNEIRKCLND